MTGNSESSGPAAAPDSARLAGCVGLAVTTVGRTLSPGESGVLTSMTWTRGPLHTDATVAEASEFRAMSLAGPLLVAVAAGLWNTSAMMPTLLNDHGIRLTAVVGSTVRYARPVLVGETVHLVITLSDARLSRNKPGRAVLHFEEYLMNQRGERAVEIDEVILANLHPGLPA